MTAFNLDKEPKITSGFKTPDDYFDHLSAKVLGRLHENEPQVIPIYARKKTWIYSAAAVLVISLLIPLANNFSKPTPEIDSAMLENYIASHSEISSEDIAENLSVEDIRKIQIDSDIEDKAIEDLLSTNSNLEEYMID